MGSIFRNVVGFGKRKRGGTVAGRKKIRRMMVRSIVKKLKAAGKPVNLQDINQEVLNKVRRRHSKQRSKQQ